MVPMLYEELCTNYKPRFFSMLVIGAGIKLYYVAHITSPLQHCEIVCSYAGLWVEPHLKSKINYSRNFFAIFNIEETNISLQQVSDLCITSEIIACV
jgi:hypothetical protein